MNKLLTGFVSGIALLGLAACGDTDDTTTQGIEDNPDATIQEAPADGAAGGGADTGADVDADVDAGGGADTGAGDDTLQ